MDIFIPCVIGSKLSMLIWWPGARGGAGMMHGAYFPFISWFPPSGCFLPTVVVSRVWTGQRRACSTWLVALLKDLLKDERGVETSRKWEHQPKRSFRDHLWVLVCLCLPHPLVGSVSFLSHGGFQDNGSVLCVFSFYHALSRKCSRDPGLKNIKSSSRGHSTPSPHHEEPVWALMYIGFLFLWKQTLFTLLHRQRQERKDMTRSCGDGVEDTNGRGNNGHIAVPQNFAIVEQLVVMEHMGKISVIAPAVWHWVGKRSMC